MKNRLLFGRVAKQGAPAELRQQYDVLPMFIGNTKEPGTFRSDVAKIRGLAGPRWNAGLYDLLTVMCTLREADRFFPSKDLEAMSRRIAIAATVHDADRWHALTSLFRHAVYRLSEDKLEFHPVPLHRPMKEAAPLPQSSLVFDDEYAPDCVCLFSGGADSFCGAAHLLEEGRRPIFVSVGVGGISKRQQILLAAIRSRFPHVPERALVQLTPWPNRLHGQHRDKLQRLRAMFFFSLAAIVGRVYGVDELFMCENGIVGSAITFSPSYDNATITRPAEPRFLRAMQDFLREALHAPRLRIRNPFQYMTKGEMLRAWEGTELAPAMAMTVSCWRSGNQGIRNCGACVPCLFRQLAFDESGVRRRGEYRVPIPKGRAWRKWKSRELERLTTIRDYSAHAVAEGMAGLLDRERVVMDAIDMTGGTAAKTDITEDEQAALDEEAPRKMADAVLRFARAVMQRLP